MIGIFDSGIGGLSVWKEIVKLLPSEDCIYYADSANCPYGPKSVEFIEQRASEITKLLINKGCEIIVVACNTATAAAIDYLRANFDIPFVGMEPAIKPAAIKTKTGVIGVLATAGTFKGHLYRESVTKYGKDVDIIETVGEGFVEMVEAGNNGSEEAESLVRKYVEPMIAKNADIIVLGCTHYPFLESLIKKVAGVDIQIINPAPAVAKQVMRLLPHSIKEKRIGHTVFLSSGNKELLERMAESL